MKYIKPILFSILFIFLFTLTSCSKCFSCNKDEETQNQNQSFEIVYEANYDNSYYIVTGLKNVSNYNIVIPNEHEGKPVKQIKEKAFYNYTNLSSVVVPNSVVEIGKSAFEGCNNLRALTIPFVGCNKESLDGQFYEIFGKEEYIPNTLEEITFNGDVAIPDEAFTGNQYIKTINIKSSIPLIGKTAFTDCPNLESINVEEGNQAYKSIDGNLYSKDGSVLIQYAVGKDLENFQIPSGVKYIGDYAFFKNKKLKTLTMNNELISIGVSAFTYCSNLQTINFSENLETIKDLAFMECSSLKEVIIPDSLKNMGKWAFVLCNNIEKITLPFIGLNTTEYEFNFLGIIFGALNASDNNAAVPISLKEVTITGVRVPAYAFYGCTNIKTIKMPNALSIGTGAFESCINLDNVELARCISFIGENVFRNCSSLDNVYFRGKIEYWCDIEFSDPTSNPMYYATKFYMLDDSNNYYHVTSLEIPNTIETIGDYQFYGFDFVTNINLPNTITSIGISAFTSCSRLKIIQIPNSVTTIGAAAFKYCYDLKNIEFSIDSTLTTLNNYVFSYCSSLTTFTLPNSITTISSNAFEGCSGLIKIKLTNNITTIDENAFYECSNLSIYCEPTTKPSGWNQNWNITNQPVFWGINETNLIELDNIEYILDSNNNTAKLVKYKGDDKTLEIPSKITHNKKEYNVISIESCAIARRSNLTKLIIPNDIEKINYSAIINCVNLESITIPYLGTELDATTNNHFGYIFGASSYLENENYVPTSLKEVIIKKGTFLPNYAFYNCSKINTIEIPSTLTTYFRYSSTFAGCKELKRNIYEDGYYLGNSENPYLLLLSVNPSKDYLKVHQDTKLISGYILNCIFVPSIEFSNNIIFIGAGSFDKSGTTNVYYNGTISDWLNINFEDAYANPMLNAKHFYLKNELNQWEEITEIHIPNTVTSISAYQFTGFENQTIFIPESITNIDQLAFYFNTSLQIYCEAKSSPSGWPTQLKEEGSIYFGVTKDTFVEKDNIQYVLDQNTNTATLTKYLGTSTDVNIPSAINHLGKEYIVTSIGSYAFYKCSNLIIVTIPKSITSISKYAFYECINLNAYCEVNSSPDNWEHGWMYPNRPIYFGVSSQNLFIKDDNTLN